MRPLYSKDNKFSIGHYIFQWLSIPVDIFDIVAKILTLNLVRFDFPLNWTIFKIKNTDRLTNYINKKLKI